jgi:hypothetical protein
MVVLDWATGGIDDLQLVDRAAYRAGRHVWSAFHSLHVGGITLTRDVVESEMRRVFRSYWDGLAASERVTGKGKTPLAGCDPCLIPIRRI